MTNKEITAMPKISTNDIRERIYSIRGAQVMLDSGLAELYQVETKALNQAVKRNMERFPEHFMFQLTGEEYNSLRSQLVTSNNEARGGRRYLPYAFTEQGVAMLSAVLHSGVAINTSIRIMDTFVSMRNCLTSNALIFDRLNRLELKQLENDKNFNELFKRLQNPKKANAVLFFKGQMWDATSLIEDIISNARKSVILIDGYVDKKNLDLFSKKRKNVTVELYTSKNGNKLTQKEITDFNNQYGGLTVKYTTEFHDRFLILDRTELYHSGASIKDAGKKAFELSIIDDNTQLREILKRIN